MNALRSELNAGHSVQKTQMVVGQDVSVLPSVEDR